MLYLNFALSFDKLADDMIDMIRDKWRNPFMPPVVIFPDRALGQWFKLRWMDKTGVIANFNTKFLDEFIFEILAKDSTVSWLKPSVMGEMIAAWLRHHLADCSDDVWADVKRYLMADGHVDENRLYDFARLMSGLFVEYETSRPDNYIGKTGIIQHWENNLPFFSKTASDEWQRELYRKLFVGSDAICVRTLQNLNDTTVKSSKTLPAIFHESGVNGDNSAPVFILWHATLGQFYRKVFDEYAAQKGHAVYAYIQNPCMEFWEDVKNRRNAPKSWSKQNQPDYFNRMTVMLAENSLFDNSDEDENRLLADWGLAGRENIALWCQSNDYVFDFNGDDESDSAPDSLLKQIQYHIAHYNNDKDFIISDDDYSLSICAAPSRLREIEHLHSQICRLMKDNHTRIRDILIVAPDINEYRTAIYQVFAQSSENTAQDQSAGDNAGLHIRFTILDGEPRESLTASALRVLFNIIEKKALMRPDFFSLIRNPLVQKVRGIDPDEVDNWQNWVYQLNIFRDRQENEELQLSERDDWNFGIRRLLMARLSNVSIDDNGTVISPFGDIASSDDASLCRFIDCIKDLEDMCQRTKGASNRNMNYTKGLTEKQLFDEFMPFVNGWISLKSVPKSLTAESIIYQSVIKRVSELKYQYAAMDDDMTGKDRIIPWKYIEQALCSAAETSGYTSGSIFVNGLTFMNFTSARVLPVKHLFMLGMSAGAFPGRTTQSSLDLRRNDKRFGDTDPTSRNRYAFLCQLMSVSESLHISYVNKDLKKDEAFYPSSVVNDLIDAIKSSLKMDENSNDSPKDIEIKKEKEINKILYFMPLDEERCIQDLFTSRELRNYHLYRLLMNGKTDADTDVKDIEVLPVDAFGNLPERVSLWLVQKYLEDPFQMRVSVLLNYNDYDPNEDPEQVMYEPVDIDDYVILKSVKEIVRKIIEKNMSNHTFDHGNTSSGNDIDYKDLDVSRMIDDYIAQLKAQNVVFENIYELAIRQRIENYATAIASQICSQKGEYELAYQDPFEVEMNCDGYAWTLICNRPEWHTMPKLNENGMLRVAAVKLTKFDGKIHEFLPAYTTALACLARLKCEGWDGDMEVTVCIDVYSPKLDKSAEGIRFTLKPNDAVDILNKVYRYAFLEQRCEAAPMVVIENVKSFMQDDDAIREKSDTSGKFKDNSVIRNLDELKYKLLYDNVAWKYFKKAYLFKNGNLGYDEDCFETHWAHVVNRQKQLVLPVVLGYLVNK